METLGAFVGLLIILVLFALVIAAVAVLVIALVRGVTGRSTRPVRGPGRQDR